MYSDQLQLAIQSCCMLMQLQVMQAIAIYIQLHLHTCCVNYQSITDSTIYSYNYSIWLQQSTMTLIAASIAYRIQLPCTTARLRVREYIAIWSQFSMHTRMLITITTQGGLREQCLAYHDVSSTMRGLVRAKVQRSLIASGILVQLCQLILHAQFHALSTNRVNA